MWRLPFGAVSNAIGVWKGAKLPVPALGQYDHDPVRVLAGTQAWNRAAEPEQDMGHSAGSGGGGSQVIKQQTAHLLGLASRARCGYVYCHGTADEPQPRTTSGRRVPIAFFFLSLWEQPALRRRYCAAANGNLVVCHADRR